MKRTVKDFVRELFKEGKSPTHIRGVAQGSRWKDQMDEVDKWIKRGMQIRKKKGKEVKKPRVIRVKKKRSSKNIVEKR